MHQLKEQTKRRAAYFTTVSSFVSCAFEDTKLGEALTSYYTLCPAGANDAPPLFFFLLLSLVVQRSYLLCLLHFSCFCNVTVTSNGAASGRERRCRHYECTSEQTDAAQLCPLHIELLCVLYFVLVVSVSLCLQRPSQTKRHTLTQTREKKAYF
jgi:hypothetical protein